MLENTDTKITSTQISPSGVNATGIAHVYYSFVVGNAIHLESAHKKLSFPEKERSRIRSRSRVSKYFDFTAAPVRVTHTQAEYELSSKFRTRPFIEAMIFDFGAISIRFQIPISGPFEDLVQLSALLYENQYLIEQARSVVDSIVKEIGEFVTNMAVADHIEDYSVFQIEQFTPHLTIDQLTYDHASTVASILCSEVQELSEGAIEERIANRISYSSKDVTFVDWNSAIVFDSNPDEILKVLEFINVALMEYSYLDSKLDSALDEFYNYFAKSRVGVSLGLNSLKRELRRIGQFQIDSAILFEGVSNALKLLGDEFLARLYRLASKRLGLADWDESISRKLKTIESIYDKISGEESRSRMEILEWIIIILIAVSILLPFIPGFGK